MILSCQSISKSFGVAAILKDISFHINDREKVAVVGINGAGKSTLFKIIIKELEPDIGEVIFAKGTQVGYLSQQQGLESGSTIFEEVLRVKAHVLRTEEKIRELEVAMKSVQGEELEKMLSDYTKLTHAFELENGYACRSEVTGVLKGLGFLEEEFDKIVDTLSGGQKTRVALGKLLLSKPDIILLDEPTNHLDMGSIAWLETFLSNYDGAVLVVAHDRYFLDKVVSKVIEIENNKAIAYEGNYSAFAEKKARNRETEWKHFINQQREIKHQEEVITKLRSFNREKSIKRAESREKLLDKVERLDKPVELNAEMNIKLEPNILSGNDVLMVEGLSKSFGSNELFRNISFEVKRGEKVALIGDNGTGKTTMLKIINGLLAQDEGEVRLGSKVYVGYYDQEQQVLDSNKTIFNEIQDTYPRMDNTQVRNVLASFLFTRDDVFKLIKDISGGERGRISLAKLMLSDANLLILDEPTNHLDMISKEILENAIMNYGGTVLYVSHDRYFINKTATRILDLSCQNLLQYIGNYDYYLEKKEDVERAALSGLGHSNAAFAKETSVPAGQWKTFGAKEGISPFLTKTRSAETAFHEDKKEATGENKNSWEERKKEQALQRKKQNELNKVEEEIQELERRSECLDRDLLEEVNYSNPEKLLFINQEKVEIALRLEELLEKWEALAED